MKVLDLEDLNTLWLLAGSSNSLSFISEFTRSNGDSDVEEEDLEFVPAQSRSIYSLQPDNH